MQEEIYEIRTMERSDVTAVRDTANGVAGFDVGTEADAFWDREQLNNWVESADDVLLVAYRAKALAGFVLSQHHKPTGKATIENIYVRPEDRKTGLGATLMNACVEGLQQKGARFICSFVKPSNSSAVAFHQVVGFDKGEVFYWMEY